MNEAVRGLTDDELRERIAEAHARWARADFDSREADGRKANADLRALESEQGRRLRVAQGLAAE